MFLIFYLKTRKKTIFGGFRTIQYIDNSHSQFWKSDEYSSFNVYFSISCEKCCNLAKFYFIFEI